LQRKREGERKVEMGEKERESTPSRRTLRQINQSDIFFFFSPRCLFSLSNIMAERGRDEREIKERARG